MGDQIGVRCHIKAPSECTKCTCTKGVYILCLFGLLTVMTTDDQNRTTCVINKAVCLWTCAHEQAMSSRSISGDVHIGGTSTGIFLATSCAFFVMKHCTDYPTGHEQNKVSDDCTGKSCWGATGCFRNLEGRSALPKTLPTSIYSLFHGAKRRR